MRSIVSSCFYSICTSFELTDDQSELFGKIFMLQLPPITNTTIIIADHNFPMTTINHTKLYIYIQ